MLSIRRYAFALAIATLLAGCSFAKLHTEVLALNTYGVIHGSVVNHAKPARFNVIAYTEHNGIRTVVEQQAVSEAGHFTFVLPRAAYGLVAYDDQNESAALDAG